MREIIAETDPPNGIIKQAAEKTGDMEQNAYDPRNAIKKREKTPTRRPLFVWLVLSWDDFVDRNHSTAICEPTAQ